MSQQRGNQLRERLGGSGDELEVFVHDERSSNDYEADVACIQRKNVEIMDACDNSRDGGEDQSTQVKDSSAAFDYDNRVTEKVRGIDETLVFNIVQSLKKSLLSDIMSSDDCMPDNSHSIKC